MGKKRFRLMVAILAVFSLVASACFGILIVKVKKAALSNGEKTGVVVDLGRFATDADSNAYVFILIGWSDPLDLVGVSKFDMARNFGGRFTSVSDNALRDYLQAGGNCLAGGADADDMESAHQNWRAYRTTVKVDSSLAALGAPFRIKVKFQRNGGTNSTFAGITIISGWSTETSSSTVCTGVFSRTIPFEP